MMIQINRSHHRSYLNTNFAAVAVVVPLLRVENRTLTVGGLLLLQPVDILLY